MPPDLSVILVHYHTPLLAAEAVAALRTDVALSGLSAEWRLVDNGSDEAGREVLSTVAIERLDPGRNLGYAGAVNLGIERSTAELILIANPDVLVEAGCLGALCAALRAGAAIAGPRFFWDRTRRLLLPPAERRGRSDELLAVLAGRSPAWASRARRRWRRHARRHWEATETIPSHDLSGGLLLFSRQAFHQVGPFDDGFQLYFEETDWLLRARRLGLGAAYVPAAHAVHLYNQSAVREPRAAAWFEASAQRFRRRHHGRCFTSGLSRLGAAVPAVERPPEAPERALELSAFSEQAPLWIELSPHRVGFPAAAERLSRAELWMPPAELAGAARFATATDGAGRELGRWTLPEAA
jgi:GT2 family glycosyltransferase